VRGWPILLLLVLAVVAGCPTTEPDPPDDDDTAVDCGDAPNPTVRGIELVLLCAATFDMGCTPGQIACQAVEEPVHPVTLSHDTWIGRTEVTQRQFEGVMGYDPSGWSHCGPDCPVEQTSWHESAAFTNALSAVEGLPSCYACTGDPPEVECSVSVPPADCGGYRLPTEAEWEYAARGGEDLPYAGSADLDEVAWHSGNSGTPTHPVAGKQPNGYGLYDMSGNVFEWTQDHYGPFTADPVTDPAGPPSHDSRVARGGSCFLISPFARTSMRHGIEPNHRAVHFGFRVARTHDGEPVEDSGDDDDSADPDEWCSNYTDDDGDGDIDCRDDDCAEVPLCATEFDCFDGVDNNDDGLVDCAAPECASGLYCFKETICADGLDDDGDGLIDCTDQECWADPACLPAPEICDNSIDDDHDFLADCADSDCAAEPACQSSDPCCLPSGTAETWLSCEDEVAVTCLCSLDPPCCGDVWDPQCLAEYTGDCAASTCAQ